MELGTLARVNVGKAMEVRYDCSPDQSTGVQVGGKVDSVGT